MCGILLLPIMIWQVSHGRDRASAALPATPFPFAMICAVLGPAALLNLPRASRGLAVLALARLLELCGGRVLSVTRTRLGRPGRQFARAPLGRWAAGSCPRRQLDRRRRHGRRARRDRGGLLRAHRRPRRDARRRLSRGRRRTGCRTPPWRSGWASGRGGLKAAAERPLFGYGANNRSRIIRAIPIEYPATRGRPEHVGHVTVSNFHNGFLTAHDRRRHLRPAGDRHAPLRAAGARRASPRATTSTGPAWPSRCFCSSPMQSPDPSISCSDRT